MSSFGLNAFIALRQLRARRRQTVTVVLGVALGVTVLLSSMSLFGGLLSSFTAKVIDATPHITLTAESALGSAPDVIVESTSDLPVMVQLEKNSDRQERAHLRNVFPTIQSIERTVGNDVRVISPFVTTQAVAAFGTNELTLPLHGVIPKSEASLTGLNRFLITGSVERLEATYNGVLLGSKAAKDLGVITGDRLRMVAPSGVVFTTQVCGIYELGFEVADRRGIVNLRFAQSFDQLPADEASGVSFHVHDISQARTVADKIQTLTGLKADTWQETNSSFIAIFTFLRNLFFVVTGFVIVICGFGVANILITTVIEKQRDVAAMKSLGFTKRDVSLVYLMQGAFIAVVGGLLGLSIGAVVVYVLGQIPGNDPTNVIMPFKNENLPVEFNAWYFVIAFASLSVVSLIASVLPARSAANVVPVRILRSER